MIRVTKAFGIVAGIAFCAMLAVPSPAVAAEPAAIRLETIVVMNNTDLPMTLRDVELRGTSNGSSFPDPGNPSHGGIISPHSSTTFDVLLAATEVPEEAGAIGLGYVIGGGVANGGGYTSAFFGNYADSEAGPDLGSHLRVVSSGTYRATAYEDEDVATFVVDPKAETIS